MLTDRQREALRALDQESVAFDVPLAPETSLGIGGLADGLVEVPNATALARLVRWCRRERLVLTPLQRATDAMVRDAGIRGVVCRLGAGWSGMEIHADGVLLGGEGSARAAAQGLQEGVRSGDPVPAWLVSGGSVANALVGRGESHEAAGVVAVQVVLGKGVAETVPRSRLALSDPRLGLRAEAVVAGVLVEPSGAGTPLPTELPGVRLFVDPPKGSSAGELLTRSGLLGVRVRGARIDDVQPNRLLTEPGATAHDVELLVDWARRTVAAQWGVELVLALRIIGARR
ncbi:MAG: hypothetical protein KDA24_16970 [Deltaproteobacteria bacterium]|nr:hypothetical protein [Deltaproteobacteria bacterium]